MSNRITNIEDALTALTPNVIAHLRVYQVNQGPHESSVLPQALWTNADELRALAFVIEAAKKTIKPRKIKQNAWDNWNGYVSGRKVKEFGLDERAAREWAAATN